MTFNPTKERTILLGFLGFALVAAMDAALGFEVSLLVLHVIPVLFVTWYATPAWGVFFAVLMAVESGLGAVFLMPAATEPLWRYLDLASDFVAMLLLVWMQSKLRHSYDQIKRQSKSDALTGCLNKAGFSEQLQAEIDRSRRYRHVFSLIYFDCDDFKSVNDSMGHHAGDMLLSEVGSLMKTYLREVDSVGRLGGDEFAALLPESDAEAAQIAVEAMKRALDEQMLEHGWQVSFSMGIATFDTPPESAAKALQTADTLMYEVKKSGKNAFRMQRF